MLCVYLIDPLFKIFKFLSVSKQSMFMFGYFSVFLVIQSHVLVSVVVRASVYHHMLLVWSFICSSEEGKTNSCEPVLLIHFNETLSCKFYHLSLEEFIQLVIYIPRTLIQHVCFLLVV